MKMLLTTLGLLAAAGNCCAQKMEEKQNLVVVDKQPYIRVEADGTRWATGKRTFYVSSPAGERLLAVKEMVLYDPFVATPANPTGEVYYVQFLFPSLHTVAELPMPAFFEGPLNIARTLYPARLLHGDKLDPQAVADFAAIHGTLYSERRQALNQPGLAAPVGY